MGMGPVQLAIEVAPELTLLARCARCLQVVDEVPVEPHGGFDGFGPATKWALLAIESHMPACPARCNTPDQV